jgi:hypothetical protein
MSLKTLYLDEYWWCGDRLKNGQDFVRFLNFFCDFFGFDFDEVHSDYIRWVAVDAW